MYWFFSKLDTINVPQEYKGAWLQRIVNVKEELITYLTALHDAGYGKYWKENIEPVLLKSIENYEIRKTLIDSIHCEINSLAGPEVLGNTYPKTYVLDIGNAFNLLDETFCTTYLLLDKEIAKNTALILFKFISMKTFTGLIYPQNHSKAGGIKTIWWLLQGQWRKSKKIPWRTKRGFCCSCWILHF